VHSVNRGERRLQRLASTNVAEKRISYGCINVPIAFFDRQLLPLIGGQRAVVYLLPETRALESIFNTTNQPATQAALPASKGSSSWTPTSTASESSSPSTMW
jgi:hypothetical protein